MVLLPQTVEDLRAWLNENEYAIPDAADATLSPYVEMGSAFIALKLLPNARSGDVSRCACDSVVAFRRFYRADVRSG